MLFPVELQVTPAETTECYGLPVLEPLPCHLPLPGSGLVPKGQLWWGAHSMASSEREEPW